MTHYAKVHKRAILLLLGHANYLCNLRNKKHMMWHSSKQIGTHHMMPFHTFNTKHGIQCQVLIWCQFWHFMSSYIEFSTFCMQTRRNMPILAFNAIKIILHNSQFQVSCKLYSISRLNSPKARSFPCKLLQDFQHTWK